MTAIDNRDIVRRFIDADEDGDTFWYTELLDRTTNGSSRFKMLRSFEHNNRTEFDKQCDTIALLCERNNVRAYTRLTPRSRKQVAKQVLTHVVQRVLDEHYDALWHVYGSACGKTPLHGRKMWLWDVDEPTGRSEDLCLKMSELGVFRARIPSRQGYHIITPGFDVRKLSEFDITGIFLHKDNPTNLYIPDAAK